MPVGAIALAVAKAIQIFPDGRDGLALMVLRLSGALAAWPAFVHLCGAPPSHWQTAAAAALVAAALAAGIWTRAAVVLLLGALLFGVVADPGADMLSSLSTAGLALAILLLGPGAYSLDARRYGRRVIRLGPAPPDGGRTGSPASGFPGTGDHGNV